MQPHHPKHMKDMRANLCAEIDAANHVLHDAQSRLNMVQMEVKAAQQAVQFYQAELNQFDIRHNIREGK